MNALEQKYLDKKIDEWQSGHLDFRGVAQTARYFYNLALADVRGEVIRLNNFNKQIAKEKKEGASKWQEGVSAGYADIISFIDNLTK